MGICFTLHVVLECFGSALYLKTASHMNPFVGKGKLPWFSDTQKVRKNRCARGGNAEIVGIFRLSRPRKMTRYPPYTSVRHPAMPCHPVSINRWICPNRLSKSSNSSSAVCHMAVAWRCLCAPTTARRRLFHT